MPAATCKGVQPCVVAIFGLAPAATRSFIASISLACVARQKAVEPAGSRPKLLPRVLNHGLLARRALGSAPASNSAFNKSKWLVFSCSTLGAGYCVRAAYRESIVAQSGINPSFLVAR